MTYHLAQRCLLCTDLSPLAAAGLQAHFEALARDEEAEEDARRRPHVSEMRQIGISETNWPADVQYDMRRLENSDLI